MCLYVCTHIVRPVVKVLDASSIIGRVALRIFGDGRSTKHLHCVPLAGTLTYIYNTVRPLSQRTFSLNICTVFPWLALSLTSTIQSDLITEDILTQHLHCVPLTGTLTYIYNTVRPHHRGHSHLHLQYSQTSSQRTFSLTSTIQSDPITENTLTYIYNTVRPHHRGHSHLHLQYSQTSSQRTLSLTSTIQSDPIT